MTKIFGRGEHTVHALGPLDLAIEAGTFVSVVGPSGCGKSTLLRLIAGLESQTTGQMWRDGAALDGPSRDVGIVFQDHVLFPWASVLENVLLPADVLGLPRHPAGNGRSGCWRLTGLKDFAGHKPHMLSGGMKQRAAFCRALLADPQLLLLDEPFGALDALTREELSLELSRLWQDLRPHGTPDHPRHRRGNSAGRSRDRHVEPAGTDSARHHRRSAAGRAT